MKDDFVFTTPSVTGSMFTGRTSDFPAYPFCIHGYFDWRTIAIARAVCKPGDTIIEVGANIGTETICFADVVGATGAVYAFEPYPVNADQLRRNVRTTHAKVEVFTVALSNCHGVALFKTPPRTNSGAGHLVTRAATDPFGTEDNLEVEVTTLDSLLSQLKPPKLVVTDVEGHDHAVLRGAQETLEEHRPALIFEAHDVKLRQIGSDVKQLAAFLNGLNYQLFEIGRYRLRPLTPSTRVPVWGNWLGLPEEQRGDQRRIQQMLTRAGLLPCLRGLNPLRPSR
jgi:FkbM family methyltransferase